MILADTHCHLNFTTFDEDRAAVLERARQAGLRKILNPGIDLTTSQAVVELAEAHAEVYAAVGVHPNEGANWDNATLSSVRSLATSQKVVAIGEIGLDYYRDRVSPQVQKRIFQMQLELAGELELPVVIHNRQAGKDVMNLLENWCLQLAHNSPGLAARPGVLHSFSEDFSLAQRAAELNFFIGITGPVTFKNAPVLEKVVAEMPPSVLLIETDAPFLTPHPHRGQRNEPAYVRFIAEKIAAIKSMTPDTIAAKTSENADRLFNW